MERPFAYIGFSYLLGLLVAFFIGIYANFIFICIILLLFVALKIIKHKNNKLFLSIIGIALSSLLMLIYNIFEVNDYSEYNNETYEIEAYLIETVTSVDSYSAYKAEVISIDNKEVEPFTIYLYSYLQLMYSPYDILSGTVTFEEFDGETGFSYKNYMIADGYSLIGLLELSEYYTINENDEISFSKLITNLRREIKIKINSLYFETTANLMDAILIGYKSSVDDDLYNDFINAGANHMLVVSGMHLSIIGTSLYFILKKIKLPYYDTPFIIIPLIILYMLISGFGVSIFRSGIMFIILIIANFLGEENEPMNSLGIAVLIICLVNPYSCVDMGFLLSVAGTAGILILAPKFILYFTKKLFKIKNKFVYSLITVFSVSLSAFVFIMPLLLVFFQKLNPLSIISSMILSPLVTLFMYSGMISILLSFIPVIDVFVIFPVFLSNLCGNIIVKIIEFIASYGEKLPMIYEGRSVILGIGIILSTAILYIFKTRLKVKILYLICVIAMITTTYISQFISYQNPRIFIAESGGDVMVCLIYEGETTVITADGFLDYKIKSTLNDYGIYEYNIVNLDDNIYFSENLVINTYLENEFFMIEYNDKNIVIELTKINYTDIYADVLITNQSEGSVISSFTFLFNSDTIRSNSEETVILDYSTYIIVLGDEILVRRVE